MTDELKKSLKKKLESYEAPLPDGLFDEVMQSVGRERRRRSLRRRTTVALWMVSAAAATVALLVGVFPRLQSGDASMAVLTNAGDSAATSTKMAETATAQQQTVTVQHKQATLSSITSLVRNAIGVELGSTAHSDSGEQLPPDATLLAENNATATVDVVESGSNGAPTTEAERPTTAQKEVQPAETESEKQPSHIDVEGYQTNKKTATKPKEANRRMSFALSVQNGFSGSGGTNGIYAYNDAMSDGIFTGSLKPGKHDKDVVAPVTKPEQKAKHHTPLRAGVSMAYQITPRLSAEAGLSYSYHSADLEQTIGGSTVTGTQQLHYVGVPVNIIYKVWGGKHLDVYATGGGRVEKMVHGRQKVNGDSRSVSISSPQWSLNAGAGVEYKISRKVGLYLEPTASYYFDNGGSVPTIYNDKPWNAEIKVGVRLH